MERMTKRQKEALETRAKLLDAARKIVCERGLAGTNVEEITASCGVAKGTFYTYFKRKEDIICALCRESFATIRDETISSQSPFPERLADYMVKFAAYIEQTSLKLTQEWIRNTAEPDFSGNTDGFDKLVFDIESMENVFKDGQARGEVKRNTPVKQISTMLIHELYGAMLCWATSNGKYGFTEQTHIFCRKYLGSILKPYLVSQRKKA